MPSDQELQDLADDWKKKGNEAFQKSELEIAVQAYSQGIVQVDRLVTLQVLLKVALLSNRAACYLKQGKLAECIADCTLAFTTMDKENDTNLRIKLLYRRAKALFLQANMPHKKKDDDLQLAAKDLLTLLSFDSSNKDANQLLQTIRAQHAVESRNNVSNTPLAKTLEALKKKDDKALHHIKVLVGMLTNDSLSAAMELGRLDGVEILLQMAQDESLDLKFRNLCLQSLSCAGSHPPFCRAFLKEGIQRKLSEIIFASCPNPEVDDLVVAALALYLRLILHLDRDDPGKEIEGKTLLEYDTLVDALVASLSSLNIKIMRAALDILSSWTVGRDRDNMIRASLDNYVDLPLPKTLAETRQMSPKELSAYKHREHQQRTRDDAWAFERAILFCNKGGLDALLKGARECAEFELRREITATLGKILAAVESEERIKNMVGPYFGYKKKKEEENKEDEDLGVVIEEIDEEEEGKEGQVSDILDPGNQEEKEGPVTLEKKMERAELASALLLAKSEVGAWAVGSGWPSCQSDLNDLVESSEKAALVMVSELISAAASVKETRPMVATLLSNTALKQLLSHEDRDIRTAAASAVTKLGLSESQTDEVEIVGLLEAACYMLEDSGDSSNGSAKSSKLLAAKVPGTVSTATTSIERGVEVMMYLVSKTLVKEELAHGFHATPESMHTGLELLVRVADMPNAGEALSAFGLASIFQLMAVTSLTLRKEAFEGKEFTMEQYDEMQNMQKTEEEKEMVEDSEYSDDSPVQCTERIQKMAHANVPRALVQLTEGASDKTLEQLVSALNRMANEPSVRGTMIQQGVLSALIKIEKEEKVPTDTKKKILRMLRHCIGKLLVTMNPLLLTSAQKMGSIKPLIQLVREIESTDLQKFEALLALTNLAAAGDDTKGKIVAEKGISSLHYAMFSDHGMVKKAATEAMSNLVPHEKMLEHLREHDTLRLWLALASDYEDNFECARAASGCLAMATQDPQIAKQLISIKNFKERVETILECGNLELMHRIFAIILNLSEGGEELRKAVINHGFLAFSLAYVQSYHDGSRAKELDFTQQDLALFNVTVDVARQVVKVCEEES
jgi:hypothetical protein